MEKSDIIKALEALQADAARVNSRDPEDAVRPRTDVQRILFTAERLYQLIGLILEWLKSQPK